MPPFRDLSEEGKLQKIRQHLDGSGHPVPADWVTWLMDQVPALSPDRTVATGQGPFDEYDDGRAAYYAPR